MTTVQQIFTKIRQMCQSCYQQQQSPQHQIRLPRNYKNLLQPLVPHPPPTPKQIPPIIINQYLTALQHLSQYIHQLQQTNQQYQHLQIALQKQQLEIRKHIGIQQQLRLYSESVKLQLEECEKEKLELLDNSKQTIKAIKMKNQMLFEEITLLKKKLHQQEKIILEKYPIKPSSNLKNSKPNDKTLSYSPQLKDSSLSKIVKTEYIERQKHPFLNVNIRKQLKYDNKIQPEIQKKQHKHHKSTYYVRQQETYNNSHSKKKHKGEEKFKNAEKQKQKKDNKLKGSVVPGKQFDLGTYLTKNQLKKSPNKIISKPSAKHPAPKPNQKQKHHKSSFQQKSQKHHSKPQTQQKLDSVKQHQKSSSHTKQKSKSKQSKKQLKSKQRVKQKTKEEKKNNLQQHNRSLFSVSSVEYRSGVKYNDL